MRKTLLVAISILAAAASVVAQHGGGSGRPKTTHAAPAAKATHVSAPHGGSTVHRSAGPKTAKAVHGGGHAASNKTTRVSSVKTTKMPTTTGTMMPSTTMTKVQLKLQRNTNLASKLQSRLPAGTNLTLAASGFRNLGQFVAAVNVSNNLGIPFSQLKTRMVDQGMSLGQAIQDTRPTTTGTTTVANRAEADAIVMIRTTDQITRSKTRKVKKSTGGN